jgi:DNA polymerase-3 subunit gamma/tau
MAYEPLHHKYRPQTFAQLVGQDAIATTLANALQQQRIAPAYLFSGPRGTGKTSSARILAKSLNCINQDHPTPDPCGVCETCRAITNGSALDFIEIDAASNTGVDNIRELIDRAQFAPAQCRYKVYVIDECHMLSTAAFNALLKTLEEPPSNVVFVLATTDPQRVLPTIISRCQRFDYRRIPLEPMLAHLRAIANQEEININDEALRLVAQISQGGCGMPRVCLISSACWNPPLKQRQFGIWLGQCPKETCWRWCRALSLTTAPLCSTRPESLWIGGENR